MYFIGDVGIDDYKEQGLKLLGGCSLNVATHFKRNTQAQAHLIYPSPLSNERVIQFLSQENIHSTPLLRDHFNFPCQDISIDDSGEKNFGAYHCEIFNDFKFTKEEIDTLKKMARPIVSPLYQQLLPIIDQVISALPYHHYIFDFHSAEDFEKDINKILPYLERSQLSQFGLSPEDHILRDKLIEFAQKSSKELLITQGAGEIIYIQEGNLHRFQPTKEFDIIDSTGAGDSFLGSFLAKSELPPQQRITFASDYAKKTLLHLGAINQEVERL